VNWYQMRAFPIGQLRRKPDGWVTGSPAISLFHIPQSQLHSLQYNA
jgi:hypothetical protein